MTYKAYYAAYNKAAKQVEIDDWTFDFSELALNNLTIIYPSGEKKIMRLEEREAKNFEDLEVFADRAGSVTPFGRAFKAKHSILDEVQNKVRKTIEEHETEEILAHIEEQKSIKSVPVGSKRTEKYVPDIEQLKNDVIKVIGTIKKYDKKKNALTNAKYMDKVRNAIGKELSFEALALVLEDAGWPGVGVLNTLDAGLKLPPVVRALLESKNAVDISIEALKILSIMNGGKNGGVSLVSDGYLFRCAKDLASGESSAAKIKKEFNKSRQKLAAEREKFKNRISDRLAEEINSFVEEEVISRVEEEAPKPERVSANGW